MKNAIGVILAVAMLGGRNDLLRAQGATTHRSTEHTLDLRTRESVMVGIIRALASELAGASRDTTRRPWKLFTNDSGAIWTAERVELARLLRAREPRDGDRLYGELRIDSLRVTTDSALVTFTISTVERCDGGTTARGTDYYFQTVRRPTWRISGPEVTRLWDGASCRETR